MKKDVKNELKSKYITESDVCLGEMLAFDKVNPELTYEESFEIYQELKEEIDGDIYRLICNYTDDSKIIYDIDKVTLINGDNIETIKVKDILDKDNKFIIIPKLNFKILIPTFIKRDLKIFSDIKNSLDEKHYDRFDLSIIRVVEVKIYDQKYIRLTYTFEDTNYDDTRYERLMVGSVGQLYKIDDGSYIIFPMTPEICW